jgi:MOSC domain-containing protein YiiM
MKTSEHSTLAQLEAGLPSVADSPRDDGVLEMIVRRPADDEREVIAAGELDPAEGLVGDSWRTRGSHRTPDGAAHPDRQITLMNARVAELVGGSRARWPLAGDQLFVDLDLRPENLPAGTTLAVGDQAILEVTAEAHTGCGKFADRFGVDALKFVNSAEGRARNRRGIYARVVHGGVIRTGDAVRKSTVRVRDRA